MGNWLGYLCGSNALDRISGPVNAAEQMLGRRAITLLAIEWVCFGSAHFSFPQQTVDQMPCFLPFKDELAVISGMVEVSIGILILVRATRAIASALSAGMLLIYIMPVATILERDKGALGMENVPDILVAILKTLLVPNNILLMICSVFVFFHPGIRLLGPDGQTDSGAVRHSSNRAPMTIWLVASVFLGCNLAGFLSVWTGVHNGNGEGSLWSMACLAMGALLGFLFGVPKYNRSVQAKGALLPNANIDEVSDWLTKIVVGIGLVNFKAIATYFEISSRNMALSMGVTESFASALILYFSTLGLIEGYVLTRMFLAREFANASSLPPPKTPG